MPPSFVAFSGPLDVKIEIDEKSILLNSSYVIKIFNLSKNQKTELGVVSLMQNSQGVTLPCSYFLTAGLYELELDANNTSNNTEPCLSQKLEIKWPKPKLTILSDRIETHPENPVEVFLYFPEVECNIQDANSTHLPTFWLEVLFCGEDLACQNISSTKIIYGEIVNGFPKLKLFNLRCDLFTIAGQYAVRFRPVDTMDLFLSAMCFFRADWNQKFALNINTRNIFPCDPYIGIGITFAYPACILDQGDRVRIYSKLRADVASLKPPTYLNYITEKRVIKGQYALNFKCDLFSEKFIEYCFVYVGQALSGAVADIRMECISTQPVSGSALI